jgi:hypothetical protein
MFHTTPPGAIPAGPETTIGRTPERRNGLSPAGAIAAASLAIGRGPGLSSAPMPARDVTLIYLPEGPDEVRVSAFVETAGAGDATGFTGWHVVEAAARAAAVNDLVQTVERGDPGGRAVAEGRRLFERLLPEPVAALLRVEPAGRLRLFTSEAARDVPWPLLHDGLGFLGARWALGEILATGPRAAVPQPERRCRRGSARGRRSRGRCTRGAGAGAGRSSRGSPPRSRARTPNSARGPCRWPTSA